MELDPRFAQASRELWRDAGFRVIEGDFTSPETIEGYSASLLVANPPYVRHHHLEAAQKRALVGRCAATVGIKPSGLSGLYLYFVLLSHRLLAPGALSAWLIPSEFMDVNYGGALKEYLARHVKLIHIHQYDASEVQFDDALVTSSVVVFENSPPQAEDCAKFSFGGSLATPKAAQDIPLAKLDIAKKWSQYINGTGCDSPRTGPKLSDFFKIRRGLATGSNAFFILPREEAEGMGIQEDFLRPILPSPRNIDSLVIEADTSGWPQIKEQLALVDCPLSIDAVRLKNPQLASYLDSAEEKVRAGYLVSQRSPWYKQERREPAPILLTYMGRGKDEKHPLRFIRNESQAVASNMYLMLYPTPLLQTYVDSVEDGMAKVHEALLALTAGDLREGGRVYGGGLHKMEPKELASLPADGIAALAPATLLLDSYAQPTPAPRSRRRASVSQVSSGEPSAAEIRAWALNAGLDVPRHGRLGPEWKAAWRQAHVKGVALPEPRESASKPGAASRVEGGSEQGEEYIDTLW
ncbi:Eco57I restriction-modification methylase domain-containing protein [Streptomyces zagrosensis]|uniref:site-specific DNA-methyltransferase (adenine-specific) n=1 Tax=Streptomyces zagrosensis TaxID=1042984 RepID=A0A7W9Q8I8_9ACTN|nr:Eco57I restriction-modification methylase domain-containing protein [Streptomyces zagrosensis]MBB5935496.1 hypothetical protein [Streptomyces zagrosensis]